MYPTQTVTICHGFIKICDINYKIMTPKAKELYDKMMYHLMYNCQPTLSEMVAKECTIIAIDQVLKYSRAHGFIALTEEYEQIKEEIENL
jgi:hypothetical protein